MKIVSQRESERSAGRSDQTASGAMAATVFMVAWAISAGMPVFAAWGAVGNMESARFVRFLAAGLSFFHVP